MLQRETWGGGVDRLCWAETVAQRKVSAGLADKAPWPGAGQGAEQGLLGKVSWGRRCEELVVRRTFARPCSRTVSLVLFCLIRKLVFTHLISAFQFYFTFAVGSVTVNGSCFTAHGIATDLAPDAAPWASPRVRGRAEENGRRARPPCSGSVGSLWEMLCHG